MVYIFRNYALEKPRALCKRREFLKNVANYYVFIDKPMDFPGGSDGKASVYNAGDPG